MINSTKLKSVNRLSNTCLVEEIGTSHYQENDEEQKKGHTRKSAQNNH